jgi:hypothetical protein
MRLLSSFLALTLSTSAVLAADTGRLSPGHPAGVKRAQAENNTPLYVLAGTAVLAGIAVGISNHDNGAPAGVSGGTITATTTSGTTV